MIPITRGDIVDVDLTGAKETEKKNGQSGTRPCLVVQNDVGNRFSPMTIIAPITDMDQFKNLPVQVPVNASEMLFQGSKDSVIECGQLRTIDRVTRIKAFRGKLTAEAMGWVDRALAISVGLG